uniref:Uncharacterized protein n=1 Tax=Magallana gigas TaxID=29159 RepID=K1R1S8_MAGGI
MLQSKLYITCYNLAHFESFRKSEQLRCFFYTCLVKIKKNIFLILHCTENTGANIARYVFCQMFREHYMSRACAYNKRQQWHMVSPKFVNTMLPKEITCHLNEDCPIMLPVNGNPLNKNVDEVCMKLNIIPGSTKNSVTFIFERNSFAIPKIDSTGSSLQTIHFFKPDKVNNASVCHVDMSVKPDIPGNHSLCLTPREGVINSDEICLKIHTTSDRLTTLTPKTTDHITSPSYTDESVVNDVGREHCIVIDVVETASKAQGGACQVKRCEHFSPCTYSGKRAVCNCSVGYRGDLCDTIGPKDARDAAKRGRVKCICSKNGKTTQIITTNPAASLDQLVKAAGIGAGSVGGSIAIAALIYVVVQKLRQVLKPKDFKRRPKYMK